MSTARDEPVDETPEAPEGHATEISQWEFLDRVPTRDDVLELLATLPPVFGVSTVEVADYVQALPQKKKTRIPHPDPARAEQGVKVEKFIEAHTLYVGVAGRLKMVQQAAEFNGWSVDFEPEPNTPTGVPGWLEMGERIVYREYMVVRDGDGRLLGRKPGTAWVPRTGGSQAAGSNPYEKVETSARGRAIAAWGFGVLPGSGVASLEEVTGAGANRAAIDAEEAQAGGGSNGGRVRESRDDMLQRCLAVAEELRQERGISEEEAREKTAEYLHTQLGVKSVWNAEEKTIDWAKVKDGQILLLTNSMTDALRKLRDAGSGV